MFPLKTNHPGLFAGISEAWLATGFEEEVPLAGAKEPGCMQPCLGLNTDPLVSPKCDLGDSLLALKLKVSQEGGTIYIIGDLGKIKHWDLFFKND